MNTYSELIYLASPYSKYPGGRQSAYEFACMKAGELMAKGHKIFCPIAHSHSIEQEAFSTPKDGDWWLAQDFAVLRECKELWVYQMPGWEDSYGVAKEIEFAKWEGIPIKYIPFDYDV